MTVRSKLAAALAASALVLVSASPAAARGYDGRWGGHHHRGHDNSGAVIGAILGVGILAAIATSASRSRNADRSVYRGGYDPRYDNRGYDGGYGDDGGVSYGDEDAAVDACAIAARDQATRNGSFAEVRDITGSRPFGNGWDVTGVVSERVGYRGADSSRLRSFRCIWDNGRVEGVNFS